ncbi:MAG: DegT/DnrJ/EryC1/StrS family aminotransferase [Patescibacteria group bacterium]
MISAEFAPNEQAKDAIASVSLLLQPWRWYAGDENERCKEWLADEFHTHKQQVHLFLSGRAALSKLMTALGAKPGDQVIVTGFTCEAVVVPLLQQNLSVSYWDITKKDYCINPKLNTPPISRNTKYLLIQHTFGIPPQRSMLFSFAKKHNLTVIEDLAHGWSRGVFDQDQDDSIKLLSFGRSKSLSSVFGGAIITANKEQSITLNDVYKQLPSPSIRTLIQLLLYKPYAYLVKSTYGFFQLGKLIHAIGMKSHLITPEISQKEKRGEYDTFLEKRYPNALAILLLLQINRYEATLEIRKDITKIYKDALKTEIDDGLSLARFPALVKDRESLLKEAKQLGWYFGKWYTQPVAPAELDLKKVMYPNGSCPVSEEVCRHIVNLPTNVTPAIAKQIARLVSRYQ